MGFKEMRLKAGKTILDVQNALSVSDAAVYYWESGAFKPAADKLLKLAKLYNCSVDDLLKGED